ncbi:MAG: flagellar biosynthetic protein FliR, partial [Oscillospiraceae bacterium]
MPITMENITGIVFILARMSGCIFLNPIFGRRNVPAIVKASIVMVLTLLFYSYSPLKIAPIGTVLEYTVLLLKEFAVGYTIGFIMYIFSSIIILGGEMIDFQIGISMAKVFDAQSNMSVALSATFYNIIYMFLFFAGNAHLTLIKIMLNSSKIVPYGNVLFGQDIAIYIVNLFCESTVLAMKFAMPIIGIGFMIEIGVGILMKIIPQINIFVVNIQLKLLVGFCAMM